ncbi:MAG: hypothetical protein M1457_14020 [bacterium]|nr:hypothetical protein [bacterium]
METHLKRFGWLYLTLAALVAVPLAIIRAQRVPPLNPATLRAWAGWLDGRMEKRFGPPAKVSPEQMAREYPATERITSDPRFELVREAGYDTVAAPIFASMMTGLRRRYGPALDAWAAWSKGPLYYTHVTRDLDILTSSVLAAKSPQERLAVVNEVSHVPNFLAVQTRTQLERALGESRLVPAASDADWSAALGRFDAAAHMADPFRVDYVIGHLIAVACRVIGYAGFDSLLAARPLAGDVPTTTGATASESAPLDRAALTRLIALRATDPQLGRLTLLQEKRFAVVQLMESAVEGERNPYGSLYMLAAAASAARQRDLIHDPALRRWADAYAQRLKLDRQLHNDTELFVRGGLAWTTVPAARRFLSEALTREASLLKDFPLSPAQRRGLDPWTMAFISQTYFWAQPNFLEALTRTRVSMTKGRLLEAAFAARLCREAHGRWPERLSDLVPAYLPAGSLDPAWWAARADATDLGPNTPFLPYRIGWLPTTDPETRATLWGQSLPLRELRSHGTFFDQFDPSQGRITTGFMGEGLRQPVLPLAIAEAFSRHPRLVESAEVSWTPTSPQSWRNAPESTAWHPLNPELAWRVTDRWIAEQEAQRRRSEAINRTPATFVPINPQGPPPNMIAPGPPAVTSSPAPVRADRATTGAAAMDLDTRIQKERELADRGVAPGSPEWNAALGLPQRPTPLSGADSEAVPQPPPAATADTIGAAPDTIGAIRLTAKLRAPARVLAVWSPGPDGRDDGARLAYDPTNGTVSPGDIIVYPQGY